MIRIFNIQKDTANGLVKFDIIINGDSTHKYKMALELNKEMYVVDTNVPDDLRCYADKSRAALRKYIDTDFPEVAYYCCF